MTDGPSERQTDGQTRPQPSPLTLAAGLGVAGAGRPRVMLGSEGEV